MFLFLLKVDVLHFCENGIPFFVKNSLWVKGKLFLHSLKFRSNDLTANISMDEKSTNLLFFKENQPIKLEALLKIYQQSKTQALTESLLNSIRHLKKTKATNTGTL